ncbi:MAG TPA: hypothetical protein VMU93_09010 [Caulobacteraceae bacterium]|nr:hypothetical protein [Caulobacteraceae bacterium]
MADHLRAELALEALEMALRIRDVVRGGLVHHWRPSGTDRSACPQ